MLDHQGERRMKSARIRHVLGAAVLFGAALFGLTASPQMALAETAAPVAEPAAPDSKQKPAEPQATSPVTPAPATPSPATSAAPPAPEPETKGAPGAPGIQDDATTQTLDIPSRPVALLKGKSDWDSGFKSIMKSIATIEAEVAKAGLKQGGKAIAVFTETNDNGFSYEAMVPLTEKPAGKDQLGNDVQIGASPAGKAIKFQHRGAYDDIDSTYDLITAYLDEKGLEAQNLFIEEYLTDTKNSDDQALEVDIYVFIK
jgi:effector-binding domain-containing protein